MVFFLCYQENTIMQRFPGSFVLMSHEQYCVMQPSLAAAETGKERDWESDYLAFPASTEELGNDTVHSLVWGIRQPGKGDKKYKGGLHVML